MQYSSFSRRLFALIIVIVVLIFPFGWYYYFVIARQAEIIVSVDKKIPFRIHLEGTFGNSLIPLVDSVLDRTLECTHSCSFSWLAPTVYVLTLTATGFEEKSERITLSPWEIRTLSFDLYALARIIDFSQNEDSSALDRESVEALKREFPQYKNIHFLTTYNNTRFVQMREPEGIRIGILWRDDVKSYFFIPWAAWYWVLDASRKYIIFTWETTDLYSISEWKKYTLPWVYGIFDVRENDTLEVVTNRWLLIRNSQGEWKTNPLFDDVIDIWENRLALVRDPMRKKILGIDSSIRDAIYILGSTGERRKILENTNASFLFMQDGHFWYVLANGKKMEILL